MVETLPIIIKIIKKIFQPFLQLDGSIKRNA